MKLNVIETSNRLRTHCVPNNRLKASGQAAYCGIQRLAFALVFAISTSYSADFLTAKEDEPKPAVPEILSWISDLGSNDYSKRQLATLNLSKQKSEAIPFVIQAIHDATGEKADRLFQFLSSVASDPYSDSGKLAFDSLNELAWSRTTGKSIRAEKILQVIGADQRDAALDLLEACKAPLRERELQVMSSKFFVRNPLVIDRRFTGNAADLACLKWLTDVEFARLEGPQIDRELLKQVIQLPHLKKLQLVETLLTADDLVVLRDAPDLDLLEFVYSPIGDEAVEILTSLPVWGNVYLFGTKLTQIGQQSLKSRLDGIELFMSRGGFLGVQALGNSAIISAVVPGGAAQIAGLIPGDKMLSVNGVPIHLFDDLRKQLANFADGEKVTIEFERVERQQREFRQGGFPQGGLPGGFPQREGLPGEPPKREVFQLEVTLGKRTESNRER